MTVQRESGSPSPTPIEDASFVGAARNGVMSRRTILTAASWSVPAVAMISASPAYAVSGPVSVALAVPANTVPATGAVTVTATVTDGNASPAAGEAVSLTGPTGSSFSPSASVTDGSGKATSTFDYGNRWVKPGTTATLTATVRSGSTSVPVTVLGANLVAAGSGYSASLAQAELVFTTPVKAVVSGGDFFLALLEDGTVWAKGQNADGQLGDGTRTAHSDWRPVEQLSGVTQVAAGNRMAYALLSDGTVRAWGANSSSQLGDGTSTDRSLPVAVTGLTSTVSSIASGDRTAYALMSDGSVRAWGLNTVGQVGDGTAIDRSAAVAVSGLTSGVASLTAGANAAYAVLSDGSVKAWGFNYYGQIGDGTKVDRKAPVAVTGLTAPVSRIAAGERTAYALLSTGAVVAWGSNPNGQLGDGTTTDRFTPGPVSGLGSGVVQITASRSTGHVLLSSGVIKSWGANGYGQIGDGTLTSSLSPVQGTVPDGKTVLRLGEDSPVGQSSFWLVQST